MTIPEARSGAAFRRLGHYATRRLGDETVVVPIRARAAELDSVYTLNAVGAVVWAELEGPRTPEQIAGRLAVEFDVTLDVARSDVARFLETLLDEGMIEGIAP